MHKKLINDRYRVTVFLQLFSSCLGIFTREVESLMRRSGGIGIVEESNKYDDDNDLNVTCNAFILLCDQLFHSNGL